MKRRNFIAVAFVVAVLLPGSQALGHPGHISGGSRSNAQRKAKYQAKKVTKETKKNALEAKKSRLERKGARGKKSAQKHTDKLAKINQRLTKKSGALNYVNAKMSKVD